MLIAGGIRYCGMKKRFKAKVIFDRTTVDLASWKDRYMAELAYETAKALLTNSPLPRRDSFLPLDQQQKVHFLVRKKLRSYLTK